MLFKFRAASIICVLWKKKNNQHRRASIIVFKQGYVSGDCFLIVLFFFIMLNESRTVVKATAIYNNTFEWFPKINDVFSRSSIMNELIERCTSSAVAYETINNMPF